MGLSTMIRTNTMRFALLCGAVSLALAGKNVYDMDGPLDSGSSENLVSQAARPLPDIPPRGLLCCTKSCRHNNLINAYTCENMLCDYSGASADWRGLSLSNNGRRRLAVLVELCQTGVSCLVLLGDLILVAIAVVCCFAAVRRLLAKQDSLIPRYA